MYAHDEVVRLLRIALALTPPTAPRPARLLGRLALGLTWTLNFDEALPTALEAGEFIVATEGTAAAADYLGEATIRFVEAGSLQSAFNVARQGMVYIEERRDITWLRLVNYDVMRREQEDAEYSGIPLDSPERQEMGVLVRSLSPADLTGLLLVIPLASRDEMPRRWPQGKFNWTGDFRGSLAALEKGATRCEREGRINSAAIYLAGVARCRLALGELAAADEAYAHGVAFRDRLPIRSRAALALGEYRFERGIATDEGWADRTTMEDGRLALAQLCALQRRAAEAVEWFAQARAVLDEQGARPLRAIVDYDEALMYVRRGEPGDAQRAAPLLEAALTQFRDIGMSGWIRCAESLLRDGVEWRRAAPTETEPGGVSVAHYEPAATAHTNAVGGAPPAETAPRAPAAAPAAASAPMPGAAADDACVFRAEGEYWTLAYRGRTARLRDTKGLHYIARLLAQPGGDVHVRDLAAMEQDSNTPNGSGPVCVEGDLGAILDARATAQYRDRLADARQELEEATAAGDLGQAARARHEIETITEQLAAAYGLGGRPRTAGDPGERLRKAVTNQIRRALDRIRAAHPELGRHLANALRTGFVCTYRPEHPVAWRL